MKLPAFLVPPVLATEEETLLARTLYRVVWASVGVVTLFLALLILEEPSTATRRVISALAVLAVAVVTSLLTRHGRTRVASWLFVLGLVAVLAARSYSAGGVSAPQANGFVILVLVAGVLLGTRGGVITGVICSVISLGLVFLEQSGRLPTSALTFTPLATWFYGGIWITLAIVFQSQLAWTLRQALSRAEVELAERQEAQRRLEASYEALRRSGEKFSRVFASVPAGLAVSALSDGRFIEVNDEFERIYGWKREEVIGRTSSELGMWVDPDDRKQLVELIQQGDRVPRDVELNIRGRDGRIRVMRTAAQVLQVDDEPVMVTTFVDVTAQKRSDEALRLSERKFGTIFRENPIALTVTEAGTGCLLEVNQAFLDLVGADSFDQVLGKSTGDLGVMTPESRAGVYRSLEAGIRRGIVAPGRRLNGEPYIAEASFSVYEMDGTPYFLASILDITQRVRAEEDRSRALHDLGERVKELRLLHQTAGLLQEPGRDLKQLLSQWIVLVPLAWQFPEVCEARVSLGDIVVATAGFRETPWRHSAALATGEGAGMIEVVYLEERPAAQEGPFLAEERTLIDSLAEMLVNYIELRRHREGLEELVARRTRELRTAKDEAERANLAKGTFLATMSHEIRTPMNAILGYAQMLRRDHSLESSQRQRVDIILSSGDHLLALINNVLEMSRIEAGRATLTIQTVNLRSLLHGVEQMFAGAVHAKGLTLTFASANELPAAVRGDPGRIRQVLINLLGNAVKFTSQGGISVRSSSHRLPAGHQVEIAVEDTGAGIDAVDLPRIFGVFEQLGLGVRTGGSGLGLTISREFAQLMGGDLTVASTPGVGSVFTFTFQVEAAADEAEEAGAGRTVVGIEGGQGARRVLVVDDERLGREVVNELLTRVGFESRMATTGEEAIEVHDAWHPHLILMDLRMPGIGGAEAIRRLKQAGSKSVLIAFTAGSIESVVEETKKVGADELLLKPYKESELLGTIGERLGVRYVYEATDAGSGPSPTSAPGAGSSLPELLGAVPAGLLEQLRIAAVQARVKRVEELADAVGEHSGDAASQIRALARDFRYDALVEAIELAGGR